MGLIPQVKCGLILIAVGMLTACNRDEVRVYTVAKETQPTAQARNTALPPGHPGAENTLPALTWKLPPGWEEAPAGEMRVASFRVKGEQGQADVGVFPLGSGGNDLDNVNRWRGQVGQAPVSQEELGKLAIPVPIDGQEAKLYDQAGENPGSGDKTRILAAILRKEGVAWFFKMTGDDRLVQTQKDTFVEFLKSLKFNSTSQPDLPPSHPPVTGATLAAGAPGASAGVPAEQNKPRWETPASWREIPAGGFLIAKFVASEDKGAQALVNVSMSAGEGGGVIGNVNRWRRQLGLAEASADQVTKELQTLEAGGLKTSLVDISGKDPSTGGDTRLIGVIVPRSGRTWFYKLMGPVNLVAREKDSFTKFIQSAQYPNAS